MIKDERMNYWAKSQIIFYYTSSLISIFNLIEIIKIGFKKVGKLVISLIE